MLTFADAPVYFPPSAAPLREKIRALIAAELPAHDPVKKANCWAVSDPEFSRTLGAAGLIGMTWPREYGGDERSPLERYLVIEELLAAGAPVGAHWIADRQSGPLLLRYGNEAQRRRWLPGIARGEIYSCIGLSEPSAGSDLAAVRTAARRDGDGWVVDGQKTWTTNARHAHFMIALVRTGEGSTRHAGLSQLLIPMDSEGVTVRPIVDLTGGQDFNEVFLDGIRLPADALVGTEGDGWKQVTAELSLERSGPERYTSSLSLLVELVRRLQQCPSEPLKLLVGRLTAEMWTLRLMSAAVADQLAQGIDPAIEATIVKDLGNSFEQMLPRLVQEAVEADLSGPEPLDRVLAYLLQISPCFSLRGGTREILKGVIARGLGLR